MKPAKPFLIIIATVVGIAVFHSFPTLLTGQQLPGANGKHQRAPEWQLKDVVGKSVNLSDFKGKVVILDFWATWCPPCRKEIPDFVALQKQYGSKGLVVIGVSLDNSGPASVKAFMADNGMNYPVVMGDEKTTSAYGGIQSIPTTFVIDRTGNIIAVHEGYSDQSAFEAEIKPLL